MLLITPGSSALATGIVAEDNTAGYGLSGGFAVSLNCTESPKWWLIQC
jgi:hypothetical protein